MLFILSGRKLFLRRFNDTFHHLRVYTDYLLLRCNRSGINKKKKKNEKIRVRSTKLWWNVLVLNWIKFATFFEQFFYFLYFDKWTKSWMANAPSDGSHRFQFLPFWLDRLCSWARESITLETWNVVIHFDPVEGRNVPLPSSWNLILAMEFVSRSFHYSALFPRYYGWLLRTISTVTCRCKSIRCRN